MAKLMRVVNRDQCIGCFSCMYACSRTWQQAITVEKAALRVKNYPGVEGAFSVRICYGCNNPDCIVVCPTQALTKRKGGGVVFDSSKCIHCRKCIDACVPGALQWDTEFEIPIICHHCGICASYCPNSVLALVEVE
ncbi:4Fe-4S dicluster domain-containing protein [Kosmotoga pacifica]|uniref:(Fe-S)-binding protein n=1 Tax=Kosmotoga pacifica TaxID=1330330 RepID=A0A0G2ZAY5_9BACT|nr:4Fe-4S dicluster domain-containing protein [Kosmotoga pacifica]AKI96744.1 (Fe-S)-binding protein [Kosmotoga pacifica]